MGVREVREGSGIRIEAVWTVSQLGDKPGNQTEEASSSLPLWMLLKNEGYSGPLRSVRKMVRTSGGD